MHFLDLDFLADRFLDFLADRFLDLDFLADRFLGDFLDFLAERLGLNACFSAALLKSSNAFAAEPECFSVALLKSSNAFAAEPECFFHNDCRLSIYLRKEKNI
jgi:hypothetical protein